MNSQSLRLCQRRNFVLVVRCVVQCNMSGRTTSTPKKEKSKKEIQTILEQSVDGWMKVGKKVIGKNLSPILAEKEDNVTGTGGLKRTISGKPGSKQPSHLKIQVEWLLSMELLLKELDNDLCKYLLNI